MLTCLPDEVVFQNISNGLMDSTADGKKAFAKLATAGGVQAFESRQQTVSHALTVADVTLLKLDYFAVALRICQTDGARRSKAAVLRSFDVPCFTELGCKHNL